MNPSATWRAAPKWWSNASPATTSSKAAGPSWRNANRRSPAPNDLHRPHARAVGVRTQERRNGGKLSRIPISCFFFQAEDGSGGTARRASRRMGVASVELRGLTKRYGEVAVVDDVSLTIEHGRLVCLLGPSGCGKTTTLRLIAGFVEPSAGEIRVGDQLMSSPARTLPPERRNMSMIFQSYALWPHMTVAENVSYGLKLRKLDRATIDRKLAAILDTTHLRGVADRYPGELSGGQQQRVALARALIVEPETLLLDEPLSNLDANLREEMRFEVRRLHDEYRYTTVYVTHDQSEAMTTADVIAVMNAG